MDTEPIIKYSAKRTGCSIPTRWVLLLALGGLAAVAGLALTYLNTQEQDPVMVAKLETQEPFIASDPSLTSAPMPIVDLQPIAKREEASMAVDETTPAPEPNVTDLEPETADRERERSEPGASDVPSTTGGNMGIVETNPETFSEGAETESGDDVGTPPERSQKAPEKASANVVSVEKEMEKTAETPPAKETDPSESSPTVPDSLSDVEEEATSTSVEKLGPETSAPQYEESLKRMEALVTSGTSDPEASLERERDRIMKVLKEKQRRAEEIQDLLNYLPAKWAELRERYRDNPQLLAISTTRLESLERGYKAELEILRSRTEQLSSELKQTVDNLRLYKLQQRLTENR